MPEQFFYVLVLFSHKDMRYIVKLNIHYLKKYVRPSFIKVLYYMKNIKVFGHLNLIIIILWPCLFWHWCDWRDSDRCLAWPWQRPAATCQGAAREDHLKVRDEYQREHVNTHPKRNTWLTLQCLVEGNFCVDTDGLLSLKGMRFYLEINQSKCSTKL